MATSDVTVIFVSIYFLCASWYNCTTRQRTTWVGRVKWLQVLRYFVYLKFLCIMAAKEVARFAFCFQLKEWNAVPAIAKNKDKRMYITEAVSLYVILEEEENLFRCILVLLGIGFADVMMGQRQRQQTADSSESMESGIRCLYSSIRCFHVMLLVTTILLNS